MIKVKTLQNVRLNGEDVVPGKIVEIEDNLLKSWIDLGYATTDLTEPKPEPEPEKEIHHHKKEYKKL